MIELQSKDTQDNTDKSSDESQIEQLEQELIQLNPNIFQGVNNKKKIEILRSVSVTMMHSGPLPDPHSLSSYDSLIPNGADRIMKMAEIQQQHRINIEKKAVGRQTFQSLLGQIFGFFIGIFGLSVGGVLAYYDHEWAGVVIAGGSVVSLVYAFVLGKRSKQK